ncbi:MAG: ATP synthase subunit I [Epulopiscium sp.]|nr:ATP synthase subunit I [Candidatus Epulonipiscium sp.]
MNKSFFQTLQWQLSMNMIAISLVIGIVGSFFVQDHKPFWLGLIVGTGFSIIKLYMMERSIQRSIQMDAKRASAYTTFQYIFRYTLTAIVLSIIAITQPTVAIFSAALGMITMKMAVYLYSFQEKRKTKNNTET